MSIIPAGVPTFHNNLQTLCVSDSSVEQMLLMHYYDKTQPPERYLTKANRLLGHTTTSHKGLEKRTGEVWPGGLAQSPD